MAKRMTGQKTEPIDFHSLEEAWHQVTAPDYAELMEKGQFARILLKGMDVQVLVGNAVFLPLLSDSMPKTAAPIDLSIKTSVPHLVKDVGEQVVPPFKMVHGAEVLVLDGAIKEVAADPRFDMLVCVDALYYVPAELETYLAALVSDIRPGGGVMFYQTSRISASHHIYEVFSEKCGEARPRRICAEDIFIALDERFQTAAEISSIHRIPVGDDKLLERYLQRLCNAPDLSLTDFMAMPEISAIFEAHRAGDDYELPHTSWVIGDEITIKTLAGIIEPPIVMV